MSLNSKTVYRIYNRTDGRITIKNLIIPPGLYVETEDKTLFDEPDVERAFLNALIDIVPDPRIDTTSDADIIAIAALSGTGQLVRAADGTWVLRTLTGSGDITVTNGNGVAGNPTLSLAPTGVAAGTYDSVTVDANGRVTGGTTGGGGSDRYITLTNATGVTIPKGTPVRRSGNNMLLARGVAGERTVLGLAAEDVLNSASGNVLVEGLLNASTAEWETITGQPGGLVVDEAPYFLHFATSGMLQRQPDVDNAPAGSYLVAVGYALSSTQFKLEIEPPIKIS